MTNEMTTHALIKQVKLEAIREKAKKHSTVTSVHLSEVGQVGSFSHVPTFDD